MSNVTKLVEVREQRARTRLDEARARLEAAREDWRGRKLTAFVPHHSHLVKDILDAEREFESVMNQCPKSNSS